jgi:hypothetical protein
MPRPSTKRLGEGARCSVLVKLPRPSRKVAEAFPNTTAQQRLDDLIATHLGITDRQGHAFASVFCPRKPHPFGNKYNTACCALSNILFSIELVEEKDSPPQVAREFTANGKTGGLLLRMLRSYHHTARYVVLDSGFCVLKAIIDLQKVGVYSCALIKNGSTGRRVFRGRRCNRSSTLMG